MSKPRPWESGSHEERWNSYLLEPGSHVLRNKVGATSIAELRDAENDLFEARLVELRENPRLVSRTYDLAHLQAIHLHLFQDVYEWAGDLRTVGIGKGEGEDTSFIPPLNIALPMRHAAARIAEKNLLRGFSEAELPDELAYLYDYINFAHPFREGNGRAQREFFSQLLAETGRGLDWQGVPMEALHGACHLARTGGMLEPLTDLFSSILTPEPDYPASG